MFNSTGFVRARSLASLLVFMLCFSPAFSLQLGRASKSGTNDASLILEQAKAENLQAAVLVPGFLTGADEFKDLCETLTAAGLPTVAVPMPNWHWIPCLVRVCADASWNMQMK